MEWVEERVGIWFLWRGMCKIWEVVEVDIEE